MESNIDQSPDMPKITFAKIQLPSDEDDKYLILHLSKFHNAYFASLYESIPNLGSISVAYPLATNIERYQLFMGKHSQLADTLVLLLAKRFSMMVYSSVHLTNKSQVNIEHIKKLIDIYFKNNPIS